MLLIGMDEAGYGPNLGPLVITATAWEVPNDAKAEQFWQTFDDVVTRSRPVHVSKIHVDDSKRVFQPARGIANLEKSVLATLSLLDSQPSSFRTLCELLLGSQVPQTHEPWFDGPDLPLPRSVDAADVANVAARWKGCCEREGIRLLAVGSDVVFTQRFNREVRHWDSKGLALSHLSLRLLRRLWSPDDERKTLIVADKHGGRNRYAHLLMDALDGAFVFGLEEGRQCSRYRVGNCEIRFQMKAESHFPVAVASLISKYVRELAMELFNEFWQTRLPGLKPTQGYPTDARRFKTDIASTQSQLDIHDNVLWRKR